MGKTPPSPDISGRWLGGAVRSRGLATLFRSSPIAIRSHCARCGIPLALAYGGRKDIALTAGSLDDPARVAPA